MYRVFQKKWPYKFFVDISAMARTVWVEISPDFAYSVTEQISEVSCIFCLTYRPMLCRFLLPQLAVFITRCHALRRLPVCCRKMSVRPSVRLSVCLSHAGIASKWLNISSNILHRRICIAMPFSFLHMKCYGNIPTASNAGVWKNLDFWPVSRFVSEMIQDRAIVTMERQ